MTGAAPVRAASRQRGNGERDLERGEEGKAGMTTLITRRTFTRRTVTALAGAVAALPAGAVLAQASLARAIPSSGELIPAVGLGTAQIFNVNDDATRLKAGAVVQSLLANGGSLIDTASVYGDAESVIGEVVAAGELRARLFIATKVEVADEAEFKRSLARLKVPKVDLLFLHNVRDPQQSLEPFRAWKAQGLCRYIGITSTRHDDFAAVEAVLTREKPDFVEIDYSIDDRLAEQRVLPAAAGAKVAVLTALPFGRGRLFHAVRGRDLPDWARGFAGSWAQFFLKFLLADPRITAAIPGTSDAGHMADDLGALRGPLPDTDQRRRMVEFIEAL
jgi:aryl-alcohol dehydrogenase-like predicted oxidoreductase